jgi:hypothetical protein
VTGLARLPEVFVRDLHALGSAGGAAREHQGGEVRIVAGHDLASLGLLERREGGDALGVVTGRQNPLHGARIASGCLHGGQALGGGHDSGRFGTRQDVSKVVGLEQEDRRGDDRSCSPQGAVHDPHLGTVGRHDDNAVARRYTELCESLRQPARAIGELTRRVPLALEVQRLVIAVTFE